MPQPRVESEHRRENAQRDDRARDGVTHAHEPDGDTRNASRGQSLCVPEHHGEDAGNERRQRREAHRIEDPLAVPMPRHLIELGDRQPQHDEHGQHEADDERQCAREGCQGGARP